MRQVAYVNYFNGLLDEVWGVGETFESVDHVTWISGVWIWLYLLCVCVCVCVRTEREREREREREKELREAEDTQVHWIPSSAYFVV
jgi:DMSO/TMAO reductase YedYZ heme-binding membrane subunit